MPVSVENLSAPYPEGPLDAVFAVFEDLRIYDERGIERYLRQMAEEYSLFGDSFEFAPFVMKDGEESAVLVPQRCLAVSVSQEEAAMSISDAAEAAKGMLKSAVATAKRNRNYVGIAVASASEEGTFQSTWYSRAGFQRMMGEVGIGNSGQFDVGIERSGKGLVVSVRAVGGSNGLVTALNNVLGCVYLPDQLRELQKLAAILKGKPPQEVIGSSSTERYPARSNS